MKWLFFIEKNFVFSDFSKPKDLLRCVINPNIKTSDNLSKFVAVFDIIRVYYFAA